MVGDYVEEGAHSIGIILNTTNATVLAKSLAGEDTVDDSKPHNPEDMSSQKEFIVAYSGVNTANAISTLHHNF